jgi:hypothetical protein
MWQKSVAKWVLQSFKKLSKVLEVRDSVGDDGQGSSFCATCLFSSVGRSVCWLMAVMGKGAAFVLHVCFPLWGGSFVV